MSIMDRIKPICLYALREKLASLFTNHSYKRINIKGLGRPLDVLLLFCDRVFIARTHSFFKLTINQNYYYYHPVKALSNTWAILYMQPYENASNSTNNTTR